MKTFRSNWARSLAVVTLLAAAGTAQAFEATVVATGLTRPLFLTAPTGDDRIFLVEKTGAIKLLSEGSVQGTPYLDLSDRVAVEGERGLLGLAFDPGFATNGRFYVNYIDATTHNTVIDRYTVDPTTNTVDASTAQRIITIQQEDTTTHKGGWIGFRPGESDHLYIATGDGGGSYDPLDNAQSTDSLLGKILRIDVSGDGTGYTVPTDNPYVDTEGALPEIWATGLRNPWRPSFDRETGDFWIADVGQDSREEINFEAAGTPGGRNYGWSLREGGIEAPVGGGSAPGLTDPIFDYSRLGTPGGLGNSITGGYVYRGPSIAEADGRYFFADFVAGKIFSFVLDEQGQPTDLRDDTATLLDGIALGPISSFGEDGLGRLYAVGIGGTVVAIVPEPSSVALVLAGAGALLLARRAQTRRRAQG